MMLSVLRNVCVLQRRSANIRLLFHSTQSRTYKNLYHKIPVNLKTLKKFEISARVTRLKFHTTRRLDIPPALALIARPLINVLAFLFGRYFKRWWAKQTPAQKEMYKNWFASKRGVFLGIFVAFLSSLGVYYVMHLETDPLTHRKRFIILSKQQQEALARMTYKAHLEEHAHNLVPVNHPVYRRIAAVTNNLLNSNSDLPFVKDHTWTLNVVNADTKNAYVLPGGHIFVFLGTLNMVENDDQLAIILSHEMAHVLLKHPIEQISNGLILDLLLVVPLAVIWALFPDILAFFVQSFGKTVLAILFSLPYSRGLEREADEVGLNLAAKACVDVREAVVFWGTMKALVEMGIESAELPWLSTHPDNEEREKHLESKLPQALELRLQSGCMGVHRIDPRIQFRGRSLKENKGIFAARGYLTDVHP